MKNLLRLILFALLVSLPGFAQASALTVLVGKQVTFSVTSDGTQPFTYQWMKNGTNITGATSATYVIATAALTDTASYTVSVTNSAGTALSDTAALTVNSLPAFTTQPPATLAVNVGQPITLTVVATGVPTPTLQWQKNGVNVTGATSATFTIAAAALTDAGSYACVATSSAGTATSTACVVTVNIVPPANVHITITSP